MNKVRFDTFWVFGNQNVLCKHKSTLEFTRESFLTLNGDCILGINSEKSVGDLSPELKKAIQNGQKIFVTLDCPAGNDRFYGFGQKELTLNSPISMVFRRSAFISDRTVLISCSKAAADINPKIIEYMKSCDSKLRVIFSIEDE